MFSSSHHHGNEARGAKTETDDPEKSQEDPEICVDRAIRLRQRRCRALASARCRT